MAAGTSLARKNTIATTMQPKVSATAAALCHQMSLSSFQP